MTSEIYTHMVSYKTIEKENFKLERGLEMMLGKNPSLGQRKENIDKRLAE